eukprot:55121-Eustigmatos_ZCMA.PRE.1
MAVQPRVPSVLSEWVERKAAVVRGHLQQTCSLDLPRGVRSASARCAIHQRLTSRGRPCSAHKKVAMSHV